MRFEDEKITVSYGGKVNLGNYNNIDVQASWETVVRPGESIDDAFERAWEVVEAQVEAQVSKNTESD